MNNTVILRGSKENESMMYFETNGGRTFFVRFYDEEMEEEFLEIKMNYDRLRKTGVEIDKVGKNTYRVYAEGAFVPSDIGAWEILLHKYWAMSNQIAKDKSDGTKYYVIRFSNQQIGEDEPRKIAV